jgi:anti-sigma factor RsiW
LERPFDRHIDNGELNALVPSSLDSGPEMRGISSDALRDAERHVQSCRDCSAKVTKYRVLVDGFSNAVVSRPAPPGAACPRDEDVDWHEVAAGLWPEFKAAQLIAHAALCDHCGPLLRSATFVVDEPTKQEAKLLAELEVPSPPVAKAESDLIASAHLSRPTWKQFLQWKMFIPVVAVLVVIGVLGTRLPLSRTSVSGTEFAEFAVDTHRQQAQGLLTLEVRTDSQQTLNQWLKGKVQYSLALPESPAAPGESRPHRLKGARLLQIGGQTAAVIAYEMPTAQMPMAAVSLVVAPDSVAVASGGVEVDFSKVSFHYATVKGYKVVTWSVHGLTYALVSQEGNGTQRSCMVCHSVMRDRDLSQTPTPLPVERKLVEPVWQ